MTNLLPRLEFLARAAVGRLLLVRKPDCPACGGHSTSVRARKHLLVQVRECAECAVFFTDPIYERSVFGNLYDKLYGAEGSTTTPPTGPRLKKLLEAAFRGTDKDAHDRLGRIAGIAKGRRFLELGSSWGYLLHQARAHGFDATGVEISEPRRRFGVENLGVPIVADLDELGKATFDVAYSAHTLEHFTDLRGVLPRLARHVAPEGLLILEVPHFDLATRPRAALSLVGAVHPLGFTSEFFARNLPQAGFRLRGFFDSWADFPGAPKQSSSGDVVLLLAERCAAQQAPPVGVYPRRATA